MPAPLARLTRVIEAHTTKAIIDTYNQLEKFAACAGIRNAPNSTVEDEDGNQKVRFGAASKAKSNHYGHPTKGKWAPARVFITNATLEGDQGTHKRMPNADVALQRVIYKAFQNSVKRVQTYSDSAYSYEKVSVGSNKAFGTSNSPRAVLTQVAQQMHENQMTALDAVTPKNTEATLKHKKKRSTQPLVDYGTMRAACSFWVEEKKDGEWR